jgi:hypothetical protein
MLERFGFEKNSRMPTILLLLLSQRAYASDDFEVRGLRVGAAAEAQVYSGHPLQTSLLIESSAEIQYYFF